MPKISALLVVLLLLISTPAMAADMKAEQSALLHDLLAPYANSQYIPEDANPKVFKKAVKTLKDEKLIGSGRPNFQEKGLLEKYSKALFLGNRAKEFAKEIGQIHDLVNKGNQEELEQSLSDLWVKAGRKKPDSKALTPVLESLYGAKGAEPQETINYIYEKPDHRVEVIHAKAGGRMQVNVIELNDKGEEITRTVFSGITETKPTERGDELQRTIKPEKACTNTRKTDKKNFKKIKGKWINQSGENWKISGKADALILEDSRSESEYPLKYEGTYNLGQIKAKHIITHANDIGTSLPLAIRTQLANKGHSFRVYLETCNEAEKKELRGTWSSQHVTYNGMFMTVKRVHDPYDLSLILHRKNAKKEKKPEEYYINNIQMEYDDYQKRLKTYIKEITAAENKISKKQIAEYKEKREESIQIKALQRGYKRLEKELENSPDASQRTIDGILHEIKDLEYEIDGHRLAMLEHERKGDEYGAEWLTLRNKKEKLEELANFDKSELPRARPILESLKVTADGETVLNSTHELDPETVASMKEIIKSLKFVITDFDIQRDNILRNIKWSKIRRDDEISRATIQNKKVQKSYNELGDSIKSEANKRVLLNTLADVAEIIVDGVKGGGYVGAFSSALSKLGEAYFVTGKGKGVTMYDPSKLIGEYNKDGKHLTSHADDPYTTDKWNTAEGQAKRSLYATLKEAMLGANSTRNYKAKKVVQEALMESVRKGKIKAKDEVLKFDILAKITNTLSQQDAELSEALKRAAGTAEKAVIKNEQELVRRELAKQTAARIARIGSAHIINRNMEEMSEKLLKTTVKEALYETVPTTIKNKAISGAKNIGSGIAWDALRGGVQSALDFQAEDQWKDFLNTLFISDIIHRQLKYTNKEIEKFQNDLKTIADQKSIYEYKLNIAKEIYRQYLKDKMADDTLHKTSKSFKEKQTPLDVYLDPISSTHGEKVFLKGDINTVQLTYMDKNKFPENPTYDVDVFKMIENELSAEENSKEENDHKERPNNKWHYQLPKGKKLSDISSTGELSLLIEVQ